MKLSDTLKTSGEGFSMKFLEVNDILRNYLQYSEAASRGVL